MNEATYLIIDKRLIIVTSNYTYKKDSARNIGNTCIFFYKLKIFL